MNIFEVFFNNFDWLMPKIKKNKNYFNLFLNKKTIIKKH